MSASDQDLAGLPENVARAVTRLKDYVLGAYATYCVETVSAELVRLARENAELRRYKDTLALSTPTRPEPARDAKDADWHEGEPSHPWNKEWFIAITTYGDRVVLRALPAGNAYDYTTADGTYIKADKIKQWMQFPDSEFVPFTHPSKDARDEEKLRALIETWRIRSERNHAQHERTNTGFNVDWESYGRAEALSDCADELLAAMAQESGE